MSSQILEAVSRKVKLSESVDLEAIARDTDGFSGADLQALVYNAQLEVIHETITATSLASGTGAGGRTADAGEQPIEYIQLMGPDNGGKVKSRAEEAAFQRRVCALIRCLRLEAETLTCMIHSCNASWLTRGSKRRNQRPARKPTVLPYVALSPSSRARSLGTRLLRPPRLQRRTSVTSYAQRGHPSLSRSGHV